MPHAAGAVMPRSTSGPVVTAEAMSAASSAAAACFGCRPRRARGAAVAGRDDFSGAANVRRLLPSQACWCRAAAAVVGRVDLNEWRCAHSREGVASLVEDRFCRRDRRRCRWVSGARGAGVNGRDATTFVPLALARELGTPRRRLPCLANMVVFRSNAQGAVDPAAHGVDPERNWGLGAEPQFSWRKTKPSRPLPSILYLGGRVG